MLARHATDRYPYGVVVGGGRHGLRLGLGRRYGLPLPLRRGRLRRWKRPTLEVARHPSALLLNAEGSRLFIASGSTDRVVVLDTRSRTVIAELLDPAPAGPAEGSTPNALALSADGRRLFVAEADNNAVAVFDLTPATGGYASDAAAPARDSLVGRMPVEWYPTGVAGARRHRAGGERQGEGYGAQPRLPAAHHAPPRRGPTRYTMGQLNGTLGTLPLGARPMRRARPAERARRPRQRLGGTHRAAPAPTRPSST